MATNKFWVIVLVVTIALALVLIIIFGTNKYQKLMNEYFHKEMKFRISKIEDTGRGFFSLYANHNKSDTLCCHLPHIWFIKENNIVIGDSVYKAINSDVILFFKKDKYNFVYCCEYKIIQNQ